MRSRKRSDPVPDPPPPPVETSSPDGSPAISRRQFALSLGAVALCASAEQQPALAQAPPSDDLSPADAAEVEARYQNLLRVYGSRLSVPQQKIVHRVLVTNEHMLASIRSFLVQNGDASACTLRLVPSSRTTA